MSGTDPSVRRPGGASLGDISSGDLSAGSDFCDLIFDTVLASPVPEVVGDLSTGQVLDLVKIDSPIRGVVALTLAGDLVGAVTRDILRLRACIEGGNEYEAEVVSIAGGAVQIAVRRR